MLNNNYPNIKSLIISVLAKTVIFNAFKKCRMKFTLNLDGFPCVKGKINFLQLYQFAGKSDSGLNFAAKKLAIRLNICMSWI
jgi:hypothetical protein